MKNFKKLLALLLSVAMLLALVACGTDKPEGVDPQPDGTQKEEEAITVKVGVLKGPTGMGAVKIAKDSAEGKTAGTYEISFYETADVNALTSALVNGTVHVAALPVNAGSALFNKTEGKVQAVATNALGVLSIVGSEKLADIKELKGKTIHTTGQANTPEYILTYILEKNGLKAVTGEGELGDNGVRVNYYADGNTAMAAMVKDGGYAMLPEPAATVALTKSTETVKYSIVFDVTAEWSKVSETKLVQGCLIANKDFADNYPKALAALLADYKSSVDFVNAEENVDAAAALLVEYGIVPKEPIAKQAIGRANIVCITGADMKADVSAMLGVLLAANPASIGGKLPTDEYYYGA